MVVAVVAYATSMPTPSADPHYNFPYPSPYPQAHLPFPTAKPITIEIPARNISLILPQGQFCAVSRVIIYRSGFMFWCGLLVHMFYLNSPLVVVYFFYVLRVLFDLILYFYSHKTVSRWVITQMIIMLFCIWCYKTLNESIPSIRVELAVSPCLISEWSYIHKMSLFTFIIMMCSFWPFNLLTFTQIENIQGSWALFSGFTLITNVTLLFSVFYTPFR